MGDEAFYIYISTHDIKTRRVLIAVPIISPDDNTRNFWKFRQSNWKY